MVRTSSLHLFIVGLFVLVLVATLLPGSTEANKLSSSDEDYVEAARSLFRTMPSRGVPEFDEELFEEGARPHSFERREVSGGGTCLNDTDCNNNGQCVNATCVCDVKYADTNCQHKRKSQLTAFLVEFFVGGMTGASRFYLGYIGEGVGKILLFWGSCIMSCVAGGLGAGGKAVAPCAVVGALMGVVAGLGLCASGIWQIVDWGLIAAGNMKDSDGFDLLNFSGNGVA
jgi:hypothetical protein